MRKLIYSLKISIKKFHNKSYTQFFPNMVVSNHANLRLTQMDKVVDMLTSNTNQSLRLTLHRTHYMKKKSEERKLKLIGTKRKRRENQQAHQSLTISSLKIYPPILMTQNLRSYLVSSEKSNLLLFKETRKEVLRTMGMYASKILKMLN
jgi:hypothetical protein